LEKRLLRKVEELVKRNAGFDQVVPAGQGLPGTREKGGVGGKGIRRPGFNPAANSHKGTEKRTMGSIFNRKKGKRAMKPKKERT